MTVNAKIRAVDYNTIRNQVNLVLGTGLGNTGYGQTSLVLSSTVSESNKISASDWNKLKSDITTCWNHIYNLNTTSPTTAVQHATIRSNATTSPYSQYQTFATFLGRPIFLIGVGGAKTTGLSLVSTSSWSILT